MSLLASVRAQAPQPVECTNCGGGGASALVGILLAALALVISFWSLYVTALRRAAIAVDHVPHEGQLRFSAWLGASPGPPEVQVWVVLANTGATSTFVRRLSLSPAVRCEGHGPPLLDRFERGPAHLHVGGREILHTPEVFERGDSGSYDLRGQLAWVSPGPEPEAVARWLRELRAVVLTLEWSYGRAKFMRPWVRETKTNHREIRLEAGHLRQNALEHWRSVPDYQPFADVLEA